MGEISRPQLAVYVAAAIAIGGEWGTLSEIAFARKLGRAVVALGSWDLPELEVVATPAEAVSRALERTR